MASSLPEPPPNVPRIAEVQSPATGHYVVLVRMPTQLAAKYPDKPWGTSIADIGLAKQDSDRFPDYTLVDVEPMKGSPDLYWIFQKLPGPAWTTKSKGQESLVPAKYRRQIQTVQTKQEVDPSTLPDTITGDLTSSVVQQQEDTGKAIKVDTEEVIDESADPNVGQIAYDQRQVADVTEQMVVDGTPADEGLLVISSRVNPLGNGKSIKETVSVGSWAELTASRWDDELLAQVTRTEQFVAPPSEADLLLPNTSFEIVNEDRSLKIVEPIPTAALDNYLLRHPVSVDLGDLPRELVAVEVVWNDSYAIGTQEYAFAAWITGTDYSLNKSASDSANSSASVSCEIYLKFRDLATRNLFGERLMFYLPNPVTEASILEKVNSILDISPPASAAYWPVFKPESETIITTAQSVKVSSNVQVSLGGKVKDGGIVGQEWDKGASDDFSIVTNNSAVQIPPCIHGPINVGGGTSRTRSVAATATMGMTNTLIGSISQSKTKSGSASGQVYPTSLPATSGLQSIPTTGIFIMDMDARRYKYDYTAVTVVVFDASKLA